MDNRQKDEAFVTLATNDSYAIGALVLGSSLKAVGTTKSLVVMVTTDISPELRSNLVSTFDLVTDVNVLDSQDTVNLELLSRPDLGVTFTKLHCWRLTQFKKCVFLDSDTLVLQNVDELFEREELSAAPDIGWPDCFNSGVFVFQPSLDTYSALLRFAVTTGSFDGGDQGLLNLFFSDWATKDITKRLPFIYNVVSHAFYTYQPAFKQFGKNAKIVHFIGSLKPWHTHYNKTTGNIDTRGDMTHHLEFLHYWWKIFVEHVQPNLPSSIVECREGVSGLNLRGEPVTDEQHQFDWERGQIDYLGADSFENIRARLDSKLTPPIVATTKPPQ
jgi:glycogenin glucosyltransferase